MQQGPGSALSGGQGYRLLRPGTAMRGTTTTLTAHSQAVAPRSLVQCVSLPTRARHTVAAHPAYCALTTVRVTSGSALLGDLLDSDLTRRRQLVYGTCTATVRSQPHPDAAPARARAQRNGRTAGGRGAPGPRRCRVAPSHVSQASARADPDGSVYIHYTVNRYSYRTESILPTPARPPCWLLTPRVLYAARCAV